MVTQVLITPVSDILTPEQLASMRQARAEALGFRVDHSPHKPVKTDGVYEGGAKFERDDHALNVGNAPRCYTLAQSYQVQRNLAGPTASVKISMNEKPSEHLYSPGRRLSRCGCPCTYRSRALMYIT